jgi:hypothetical protein
MSETDDGQPLRPLGVFREFSDWPAGSPSIHGAVGGGPSAEIQRRVLFYLATATQIRSTMGMVPDVVDGEAVFLSEGLQSDGDWYWRCDLAHYCVKYNVWLPADFTAHTQRHQWSPGVLTAAQARACVGRIKHEA